MNKVNGFTAWRTTSVFELVEQDELGQLEDYLNAHTSNGIQSITINEFVETPDGGTFDLSGVVRTGYENDEDGCCPVLNTVLVDVDVFRNATVEGVCARVMDEFSFYVGF